MYQLARTPPPPRPRTLFQSFPEQVHYGGSLCALELALEVLVTKDLTEEKFDFLYNEVENLLHMDHPHVSSKDTSE